MTALQGNPEQNTGAGLADPPLSLLDWRRLLPAEELDYDALTALVADIESPMDTPEARLRAAWAYTELAVREDYKDERPAYLREALGFARSIVYEQSTTTGRVTFKARELYSALPMLVERPNDGPVSDRARVTTLGISGASLDRLVDSFNAEIGSKRADLSHRMGRIMLLLAGLDAYPASSRETSVEGQGFHTTHTSHEITVMEDGLKTPVAITYYGSVRNPVVYHPMVCRLSLEDIIDDAKKGIPSLRQQSLAHAVAGTARFASKVAQGKPASGPYEPLLERAVQTVGSLVRKHKPINPLDQDT